MSESAAKVVLFIDDDPVILMAYRTRLVQAGYQVEPARDGIEAMRQLALSVPDVIILDLMLPKLKNTPVIVLSTNSIIDISGEKVLESAQRRLIKETCTPSSIIEAISEVLGNTPAS
jgi:CheY-like chemotaxis protein